MNSSPRDAEPRGADAEDGFMLTAVPTDDGTTSRPSTTPGIPGHAPPLTPRPASALWPRKGANSWSSRRAAFDLSALKASWTEDRASDSVVHGSNGYAGSPEVGNRVVQAVKRAHQKQAKVVRKKNGLVQSALLNRPSLVSTIGSGWKACPDPYAPQ